jgi:hypothetical protein
MAKSRKDKGVPVTHGYSITHRLLYKLYFSMRSRCEKPTDAAYKRYGGRGIAVSPEWGTPERFCDWAVRNGYAEGLTLERLDNDKGYSPENCAWVDRKAQARNRRSGRMLTVGGATKTLAEVAEDLGLKYGTLRARLSKMGMTERALSSARLRQPATPITLNGVSKTLREWAADAGVHYTTICHRIAEGWPIEAALTTKKGGARPLTTEEA